MLFLSRICRVFWVVFGFCAYASTPDGSVNYPLRSTKPSYSVATEEMLTDEGARALAESNPLFCSVGCLTVYSGKTIVANRPAA